MIRKFWLALQQPGSHTAIWNNFVECGMYFRNWSQLLLFFPFLSCFMFSFTCFPLTLQSLNMYGPGRHMPRVGAAWVRSTSTITIVHPTQMTENVPAYPNENSYSSTLHIFFREHFKKTVLLWRPLLYLYIFIYLDTISCVIEYIHCNVLEKWL